MKRAVYLNRQHFFAMLCTALALHIIFGVAWALSPGLQVNKVPVHVLNIKLGSGDIMAMADSGAGEDVAKASVTRVAQDAKPVPPPHENTRAKPPVPQMPKTGDTPAQQAPVKPQQEVQPSAATQAGKVNDARDHAPVGSATSAPLSSRATPSQYVRRSGDGQGVGQGSALGNSIDSEAVMMQRYTQLISMWINRQKAILNRALQPGMRGNIVIRLRIDRSGTIHYFKLDKATGVPAVDAAAGDMVRAANPIPPVPSNYPGGNMFEFLIPVGYTYQQ